MMNNTIYNYLSNNGIDISRAHGSILRDLKDYPSYYWGLKENNTREFMELCQKEKIPIIGIDVLTNENGFYELSFDVWCYERGENENDNSYIINYTIPTNEIPSFELLESEPINNINITISGKENINKIEITLENYYIKKITLELENINNIDNINVNMEVN